MTSFEHEMDPIPCNGQSSMCRYFGDGNGCFSGLDCSAPEMTALVWRSSPQGRDARRLCFQSLWRAEDEYEAIMSYKGPLDELENRLMWKGPKAIAGLESVTVDVDSGALPTNVNLGDCISLDVSHRIHHLPFAEVDRSSVPMPGVLKPLLSNRFGRVLKVRGLAIERRPTNRTELQIVKVEMKDGSCCHVECLTAPEVANLPANGEFLMIGYEIPYASPYEDDSYLSDETVRRIVGRSVFFICSWAKI